MYQPLASETESEQFCPDKMFKDLLEASQDECNEQGNEVICDFNETNTGLGCSQNKRELSSDCFEGDIKFNCVGDLPPPTEVSKLRRHEVHRDSTDKKVQMLFPFKKTPSGNLKVCRNMVNKKKRVRNPFKIHSLLVSKELCHAGSV